VNELQLIADKPTASAIEAALMKGDLAPLTPEQRLAYYNAVCKSLGLNPLTKPFGYIVLNGKTTLYALKDCTDQIRSTKGVSVTNLDGKVVEDLYIVTATGRDATGRTDCATGAVNIKGLAGEAKANAIMKGETKAKRRLTLSLCGLGILDESEVSSIPDAKLVPETHISSNASTPTPPPTEHSKPMKSANVEAPRPAAPAPVKVDTSTGEVLKQGDAYEPPTPVPQTISAIRMDIDGCKNISELNALMKRLGAAGRTVEVMEYYGVKQRDFKAGK